MVAHKLFTGFRDVPEVRRWLRHAVLLQQERRLEDIPRDRDVIIYCSCPNEVTSARAALLLKKNGVERVRPLMGGIDAWCAANFPMEAIAPAGMSNADST